VGVPGEQVVTHPLIVGVGHLDGTGLAAGETYAAIGQGQLVLEAAHHHLLHNHRIRLNTPGEPPRVQHLQQRLPRLRVTVMRSGGQEQPVLGEVPHPPHRLGLQAVEGVPLAAGRSGRRAMVGLVHDEDVEEAGMTGLRDEDLVEQPLHPGRP